MFNYVNSNGDIRAGKIAGHVALAIVALILVFGSFGTISTGLLVQAK